VLFLSFLFVLVSCSKEEDENTDWQSCQDCAIGSWRGVYRGPANFYDAIQMNSFDDLEATITINETGENYLTASILVPGYYSATLSGDLTSTYSVSFAGSNASFSATLLKKDGLLKLNGNSKKFQIKVGNVIVEEVVNFDVQKLPD
jgi:hypothetical protein